MVSCVADRRLAVATRSDNVAPGRTSVRTSSGWDGDDRPTTPCCPLASTSTTTAPARHVERVGSEARSGTSAPAWRKAGLAPPPPPRDGAGTYRCPIAMGSTRRCTSVGGLLPCPPTGPPSGTAAATRHAYVTVAVRVVCRCREPSSKRKTSGDAGRSRAAGRCSDAAASNALRACAHKTGGGWASAGQAAQLMTLHGLAGWFTVKIPFSPTRFKNTRWRHVHAQAH